MGKKIWFSSFMVLVVLASSIYVMMPDNVIVNVEKTKTEYLVYEDNSYYEKVFNGTITVDVINNETNISHEESVDTWKYIYHEDDGFILAATEYVYLYDGTTKMRAAVGGRELIYWNDSSNAYVQRRVKWKDNITTIQTYTFDKSSKDVEDLPIENKFECFNCEGKLIQFEVRDILYESETKVIESPFSFGHRMEIEWKENDDISLAKVYQQNINDKIIIKFKADESYETYFVRLYDPWTADLNVDLVSYYKFNNNNLNDSLGFNNGTNFGTINTTGKIKDGRDFEADETDYINIGQNTIDFTTEPLSINGWVNPESFTDAVSQLVSGLAFNAYGFYISNDGTMRFGKLGVSETNSGVTISTGSYQMMTLTYDGSTARFYKNGINLANNSYSVTFSSGIDYSIGGSLDSLSFDGAIDEVGIWNRTLSASEITKLYNNNDGITWTDIFVNITGTLKDSNGNNIVGVIYATNQETNITTFTSSNTSGDWIIQLNDHGNYTVSAYDPTNVTLNGDIKSHVVVS